MAAPPLIRVAPIAGGAAFGRVPDRRRAAVLIAVAALGATIALAPALAAPDPWLIVAATGLIAYHFGRIADAWRIDFIAAALPLACAGAALLPSPAAAALIVPLSVALAGWRRGNLSRAVALSVQCAALLTLAGGLGGTGASAVAQVAAPMLLLFCTLLTAGRGLSGAANDNPSMKRSKRFAGDSWLPGYACYANSDSHPGKWGVS